MMFTIRSGGETPCGNGFTIRLVRRTPAWLAAGGLDFFCNGDPDAAGSQQFNVVSVHDGWYADDTGGGVAVWGQGRFWEIRDTPFTVRETSADGPIEPEAATENEIVNVRGAIFGV